MQTKGRIFDDIAKVVTDAAGAVQGVRNEVDGAVRSKVEAILRDMEVVNREEFNAFKAMAIKAREENEKLEARIAALEKKLAEK